MTHQEIRDKFRKFFESKGHKWVESSSLLPNDPSVLFTTAGMQQFKPYYVGAADPMKDFGSLNTASIQKCVRTSDIDEVGDERHLTFFEMLGNFSFGGYFKKEAITWAHEFITSPEWMSLKIDYVTVFNGEEGVPADTESEEIWKSLDSNIVVKKFGRADNFWGPTGDEGPCGPTTEIYVDGIEIWNVVFNQYYQNKDKTLKPLETPGIDTGMGLERLALVSQFPGQVGDPSTGSGQGKTVFETDLFSKLMTLLPDGINVKTKRIISDHIRSIIFMVSDGIIPSNKDQGYILRRLIRRIVSQEHILGEIKFDELFKEIVIDYGLMYPSLNNEKAMGEFISERGKLQKILTNTEKLFAKVSDEINSISQKKGAEGLQAHEHVPGRPIKIQNITLDDLINSSTISGKEAFDLYQSTGAPLEIIEQIAESYDLKVDSVGFEKEFKEHQEKSRAGAEKKFGGHGLILDTGELKASTPEEMEKVIKLHTSTHLLHASLRKVLGEEVHQAGSDITAERLRFDFTFPRKLTPEEIKQVEDLVNGAIQKDYTVTKEEMSYEEAVKTGALSFFKLKYPPMVNVYSVGPEIYSNPSASSGPPFSRELCGGPHVEHTGIIGTFKITKEEAVSAGVRRVRAVIN